MKLNELKTLIAEARMIARTLTAKVINCVDGSGKHDKEWTNMSTVLTSLCDHIDGTDPATRMAIEVAILFGANPEEAEKMKNDMEMFCDICKKRIAPATGAVVLKHTVGTNARPTQHLCERCYGEVFEKSIKEEGEK